MRGTKKRATRKRTRAYDGKELSKKDERKMEGREQHTLEKDDQKIKN